MRARKAQRVPRSGGSARFPGGASRVLWRSARRLRGTRCGHLRRMLLSPYLRCRTRSGSLRWRVPRCGDLRCSARSGCLRRRCRTRSGCSARRCRGGARGRRSSSAALMRLRGGCRRHCRGKDEACRDPVPLEHGTTSCFTRASQRASQRVVSHWCGALYAHKILQGTKPADLPVEQPTRCLRERPRLHLRRTPANAS